MHSSTAAPQDLWTAALERLEPRYNKPVFEMWLKPMRLVDLTPSEIVLAVQTTFARDWVENRLKGDITAVLQELLGAEIGLRVVVDPGTSTATPATAVPAAAKPAQPEELRIGNLNPRYTFDDFVVGNSNRFAHAAAQAVAESPAMAYNPLFLYGGVGLGKTHLMHAIGHRVLQRNPNANIVYVSSEKFTNEFIIAIKNNQTVEFRNRYRHVDVLLIDDIQFISGKESTQEEFFHTFNELYNAGKQIVISSDKPPKALNPLEDRLRSRFEWGLIADIQPPDLETRIAILRSKAELQGFPVPPDVIQYLARRVPSNIRELEGSLNRIIAYAALNERQLSVDMAAAALDSLSGPRRAQLTPQSIIECVSKYFGLSHEQITGKSRDKSVVVPRQIAMYLVREETSASLEQIGQLLGGRDHTTVMHGWDKIGTAVQEDHQLRNDVLAIRSALYGGD
jgi:chromosomal replication initiator protein